MIKDSLGQDDNNSAKIIGTTIERISGVLSTHCWSNSTPIYEVKYFEDFFGGKTIYKNISGYSDSN